MTAAMLSGVQEQDAAQWPLTVLFDGSNPAHTEEINILKEKDKQGRLQPVDMSTTGFDAAKYCDANRKDWLARDAAGKQFHGVEALAAAYDAAGLGSYFRFCRLPGLASGSSLAGKAEEPVKLAA